LGSTRISYSLYDDTLTHFLISIHFVSLQSNKTGQGVAEFARGYGTVSSDPSAPDVDSDTTFMLASISKVFAASTVAALLDEGLISSLDDDICDAIGSSWGGDAGSAACRHPDFPNTTVSWRMLVTHRSALIDSVPNVTIDGVSYVASYGPEDFEGSFGNPTCPLTEVQDFYRATLTDSFNETTVGGGGIDWFVETDGGWQAGVEPGSSNKYSDFAFGYIAALVELATGNKTFEEVSQSSIFVPLGMNHTSWFRESLPAGTETAVPGYNKEQNSTDIGHYCFIDYSRGQLYSSANDMAKFLSSMLDFGVSDGLWSNDVGKLLTTCQEHNVTGQLVENCQYGVGWKLLSNEQKASLPQEYEWLESFDQFDWSGGAHHDGSELGIASQCLVLPADNVFIVVLTNTDGAQPQEIASRVAKIVVSLTFE